MLTARAATYNESARIMYNESARLAFLANQISTLLNEIRSAARPGARPPRDGR